MGAYAPKRRGAGRPFCTFCTRLGGDAPKSEAADGLARAIFIRFLAFLGGDAPKKLLDFLP